ncbi:hypothetical protein BDR06DRAFT_1015300 [Suillus hirtellus]|nr:hypothetical protein BDR06DRAFT_1015300 [Suillus hirtellus]
MLSGELTLLTSIRTDKGKVVGYIRGTDDLKELQSANKPDAWSKLAKTQLDGLPIKDAIDSYIKAEDPSNFAEVVAILTHAGIHDDLIRFLQMACKTLSRTQDLHTTCVAKSLFTSISNWVHIATTLIYIGENKRLWKVQICGSGSSKILKPRLSTLPSATNADGKWQPAPLKTLTPECDRFICIWEKIKEQNQVVIIDLADAKNVIRRPISADRP